ncbi:MAG: NAD(P)/FAD-dependent oxidoreductase [Actinomycetota bacterium]
MHADYLVVGAGAVGMAFADVLVAETDATVVIVDRYAKPGGHWNVAYPFVTLHQPSQFYGVSSTELSKGRIEQVGLNRGLSDLASGAEVAAYFDDVMKHTFLPTGRVRYFPLCDYTGGGDFHHKLSGEAFHVDADVVVDCTWLKTTVPSTHTPNFEVADGVRFMPLNHLPNITDAPDGYVVVGGGKTGIDAILWLLEHHVDPDDITWIVSRDAWMLDRRNTQPGLEFFEYTIGAQANQFRSIAESTSITDMFDRLEASGYFLRLDPEHRPTMFHGATISQLELDELRRVRNVVRLGHVTRIEPDRIVLQEGEVPTSPNHVHVDCSASAITNLETKPIFEDGLITPQTVRGYQPAFSAALIAHVEVTKDTVDEKNALCQVVPLPNSDLDYLRLTSKFMMNQYHWGLDEEISAWLLANRLDGFSETMAAVPDDDEEKQAILRTLRENVVPAVMKLEEYLAEVDGAEVDSAAASA